LIEKTVKELLSATQSPLENSNIFGDGQASKRILKILAGL
jgi:UDP-N-acetylglucosamine 2-epimerase